MNWQKLPMQKRQLKASWTVELQESEPEFGLNLEEELAKTLQEEIDWEITSELLIECGWTKVTTSWDMKSLEESYEIKSWCETHLKGHRKARGKTWLFEKSDDAVLFALRWS